MILLCGIPTEPPLALVRQRLEEDGADYAIFNQRHVATNKVEVDIVGGRVTGELCLGDVRLSLEAITAVYTRLMDPRLLPEMQNQPADSALRAHSAALQDLLIQWCEVAPALVVNRIESMGSNGSKPYQAQLIARYGFLVPDTLITSEPEAAREFISRLPAVIYKSMSGVRSIVQRFGPRDWDRLDRIRWCPVQFQEFVEGRDIRVHCVGQDVFATAVACDAVDYRYATLQGAATAQLTAIALEEDLAQRCVALVAGLGLAFAGIDLRVTPDGRIYCFEVNPCPGYTYFEDATGQPISRALARLLETAPALV